MKKITLCADDYGIHSAASEAIIELAEKDILQATSCLVTAYDWQEAAHKLHRVKHKTDVGLHLNFTEGKGLSTEWLDGLPGLQAMLIKSHTGLLDSNALIEEITAQYQMFIEAFGQEPAFIDGHQHVHHLPKVRSALMAALKRFNPPEHFWIRSVSPMIKDGGGLKSHIIEASGAKALKQALSDNKITSNRSFAGAYSLETSQAFRPLMQTWLTQLDDHGLIMCHPARHTNEHLDHATAREAEYNYLLSEEFTQDCRSANVELSRLRPS